MLLSVDIDDDRAYRWKDDPLYPSTVVRTENKDGGDEMHNIRESGFKLTPNMDNFATFLDPEWWQLGKAENAATSNPNIPAYNKIDFTVNGKKYEKCYMCNNFETLKAVIDELDTVTSSDYQNDGEEDYFSRLFSFTIKCENPVYIANPLYFWDNGNEHNGYGEYQNMYEKNGGKQTYVAGVYYPGEKCYLIINKFNGGKNHWAVVPKIHGAKHSKAGQTIDLKHYNWDSMTNHFTSAEWEDEGWGANQSPEKFGTN